jgi:hypothetical protein
MTTIRLWRILNAYRNVFNSDYVGFEDVTGSWLNYSIFGSEYVFGFDKNDPDVIDSEGLDFHQFSGDSPINNKHTNSWYWNLN